LHFQEKNYSASSGGWFEDNNDPDEAGKCRIRIFGVHSPVKIKSSLDGIPTDELPWAQPCLGLIEGSVSLYGLWSVPLQGSHVFVFFESGNILQPRFFATAPGIPDNSPNPILGFNDPAGEYPAAIGAPDWDAGLGQYPHNLVLHVHGGHIVEIDSTPTDKRIRIYHDTGTYVLIDKDGNININGVKNETKDIAENETINIGSDKTEAITGSATETVNANKTISVSGNFNITVSGNATIAVTGAATITGNPISLN